MLLAHPHDALCVEAQSRLVVRADRGHLQDVSLVDVQSGVGGEGAQDRMPLRHRHPLVHHRKGVDRSVRAAVAPLGVQVGGASAEWGVWAHRAREELDGHTRAKARVGDKETGALDAELNDGF